MSFQVRNEIKRRFTVWQTRREMSSSSGAGGKREKYRYEISSEKNTTYNRTTTSAQRTPDLYRFPLSEIKEVPPSEKIEKGYSFKNSGAAFESDSEPGVKENKDRDQELEGDKESEENNSVKLKKDSVDKDTYFTCDGSSEYM